MVAIKCFFAERTELYQRSLRRYAERPCESLLGFCNAENVVGVVPVPPQDGDLEGNCSVEFCETSNPDWPKECCCGYCFQDTDVWQWNQHRLYRNPETNELFILREAPVGAMWYADWMAPWAGPDGHCLCVVTPGGEWLIDGPTRNSNGRGGVWTRTGIPPNVTAVPSIQAGDFHGWLRDGVLVD